VSRPRFLEAAAGHSSAPQPVRRRIASDAALCDHQKTITKGKSVVRVAVFGLGYVGVVSAACLARDGHHVIGVDPNTVKTDLVNAGRSPIVEPGLDQLIAGAVSSGQLKASSSVADAVQHADVLFVCVGTPGSANGNLDLSYVRRVSEEIGRGLATSSGYKVVVYRSTMLPGSMEAEVIPTLRRQAGDAEFGVCLNPEFLREGTAIYDFDHPPKTLIGTCDRRAAETLSGLYSHLQAPLLITDLNTAEMAKYVDNSWHALKVSFANEMGRIAKAVGVDSRELMRLFCEDQKLNISAAYLRPGFAFGGSCLPKDVRALLYRSKMLDVNTPVLSAILPSNRVHIDQALTMIEATGRKRIGLLGLSFKAGTDDLRESPVVALAERLIGKGYELRIFDRNVHLASLVGANRDYILNHIPHIGRLLDEDYQALFAHADVIVIANTEPEFPALIERHGSGRTVIDLVGAWGSRHGTVRPDSIEYHGIAW
jgi:GDP-mannose 6-dehydrogenase